MSMDKNPAGDHPSTHHLHSTSHMKHCFDYLRQALICSADTTLEKLRIRDKEPMPSADGWGVTHQCRDYAEISQWAKSHRATGGGGIQ